MLARRSLLIGLRCWAALDAPLTRVGAWGCFDAIGLGSKAFGGQEGAAKPKRRASSETRGSAPAKPKVAVGDVHEREARFSYAQVREFALLTGDTNPIHSAPTGTEAEARGTCIVPGILCASLFPTIIGSTFPGKFPTALASPPRGFHRIVATRLKFSRSKAKWNAGAMARRSRQDLPAASRDAVRLSLSLSLLLSSSTY